jgi:hypothetical protein
MYYLWDADALLRALAEAVAREAGERRRAEAVARPIASPVSTTAAPRQSKRASRGTFVVSAAAGRCVTAPRRNLQ